MSVSRTQILEFAKYVSNSPALPEFVRRMDEKIYNEFTKATTDEERLKIGRLYDAFSEVMAQFQETLNEMREAEAKADKEEAE